jgi:hypothetical protein
MIVVSSGTSSFAGVGHDDVGSLFCFGDEFYAFVLGIKWGSSLRRSDGENFDPLHVLLDVGAIDVANNRSTRDERRLEYALGQLRAGGTPRGKITIQARYFNLNASRHRALIYSLSHIRAFRWVLVQI